MCIIPEFSILMQAVATVPPKTLCSLVLGRRIEASHMSCVICGRSTLGRNEFEEMPSL